jgi:ComEC/Rec2-related protein
LALAVIAGGLTTYGQRRGEEDDCRLHLESGAEGTVIGWFEGGVGTGVRPFRLVSGLDCEGSVRALQRGGDAALPAGIPVRAVGTWQRAGHPVAGIPASAGTLLLADVGVDESVTGVRFAGARARVRGRIESRMRELLPETWPLASALILARKEALDPDVREAFAVAGIAHLLAISGCHVGVVALLVSVIILSAGAGPRRTPAYAASITWLYIGLIGFPAAATRAALILTFLAAARLRARPAGALGAIASAGIILFLLDPDALGGPGFQLSFASCGLLHEAFKVVEEDEEYLEEIPAFQKQLMPLLRTPEVRRLRDTDLKVLRNKVAFHFDRDVIKKELEDSDDMERTVALSWGSSRGDIYFTMPDLLTFRFVLDSQDVEPQEGESKKEGETERLHKLIGDVSRFQDEFCTAAEIVISSGLLQFGCHREDIG